MTQGLVSIFLAAMQIVLACPLVQCDSPGDHVQVEFAHQVCCDSVAAESKTDNQTQVTLERQSCTDTPIQLPQWTLSKPSGDRDELLMAAAWPISGLYISADRRLAIFSRPVVLIDCSDGYLRQLRTVILTV